MGSRAPRSQYRAVGPSQVDETLFGSRTKTGVRDGAVNGPIPGATKLATLLTQRSKAAGPRAETDSVMITRADIERMRGASSVLTPEEVATIKKERVRAGGGGRRAAGRCSGTSEGLERWGERVRLIRSKKPYWSSLRPKYFLSRWNSPSRPPL